LESSMEKAAPIEGAEFDELVHADGQFWLNDSS
jgi:hypothetical protein